MRFRCPLVRLHEGGGGSVGGTKKTDSRDTNSRLASNGSSNGSSGNDTKRDQPPPVSVSPAPAAAAVTPEEGVPKPKPKPKLSNESSGAAGNVFADNRFTSVAEVLATVPVACAALGSVAGLPASRFVASHFTVRFRTTRLCFAVH